MTGWSATINPTTVIAMSKGTKPNNPFVRRSNRSDARLPRPVKRSIKKRMMETVRHRHRVSPLSVESVAPAAPSSRRESIAGGGG